LLIFLVVISRLPDDDAADLSISLYSSYLLFIVDETPLEEELSTDAAAAADATISVV
jgi:hypothetical protein